MGLFNNDEKEARKQFKAQLDLQRESSAMGVTQQLTDQATAFYDPQVSAMLLENNAAMLNWRHDARENLKVLSEKDEGLIEPFGFEQLAFLSDKRGEKGFCASSAQTLRAIRLISDKYGMDDKVKRLFNDIAGAYQITLLLSRADGKPQQLAKSQIIKTSGEFIRDKGDKKGDKLFGLF